MKYTIIICFLFVLSNSLKEFNNKFSKEKSLLRHNYGSNIEDSKDSPCNAETKDKCKVLPFTENNKVCCCFEKKINDKIESEGCEDFPNYIDKQGEIANSKEFYSYNRELKGYKIIVEGEEFPEKEEEIVTCKNGVNKLVFDNVYSEKEKNVLEIKKSLFKYLSQKTERLSIQYGRMHKPFTS